MKSILLSVVFTTTVIFLSSCKNHSTDMPPSDCAVVSQLSALKPGSYWIFSRTLTEQSDRAIAAKNPIEDSMVLVAIQPGAGRNGNPAYMFCDFFTDYTNTTQVVDTTYWTFMNNQIWALANVPPPCDCQADTSMLWRLLYDCNSASLTLASTTALSDSIPVVVFDSLSQKEVKKYYASWLYGTNTVAFDGLLYISTVGSSHDQAEQFTSTLRWLMEIQSNGNPKAVYASNGRSTKTRLDSRTMQFVQDNGIICYERRVNKADDEPQHASVGNGTAYPLNYERTLARYKFVK